MTEASHVYTIVLTMSNYNATVIKTGNSYALRIPKQLVDEAELKLGEKVHIGNLQKYKKQDHQKVLAILKQLQASSTFKDVDDPVAWQQEVRRDRKLPYRD